MAAQVAAVFTPPELARNFRFYQVSFSHPTNRRADTAAPGRRECRIEVENDERPYSIRDRSPACYKRLRVNARLIAFASPIGCQRNYPLQFIVLE